MLELCVCVCHQHHHHHLDATTFDHLGNVEYPSTVDEGELVERAPADLAVGAHREAKLILGAGCLVEGAQLELCQGDHDQEGLSVAVIGG